MTENLIRHADLFHTGIVVDDLDAAKEEMAGLLGVTWGPQGTSEQPCLLVDGPQMVTFGYAYTAEGPHRLELVQAIPGTLWTVRAPGQAHHLGYRRDDVPAASAALAARGAARVAKIGTMEEDDPAGIVYHQARSGPYIELIDRSLQAGLFGGGA